ncbi:MAG: hypothetical protein PHU64_03580, partial [Candidatus Omnitrophica bacterium]|nr:hypothetical protein [Candidatus Omnitrophota bacterium]
VEEELNNKEFLSQFERAAKELGIKVIHANSPQAKGRVERSFKTDQDRLVKEMRLAKISTVAEANNFLRSYWPKHNKRFSVKPLEEADLHRPVPKDMDLDAILCRKTEHPLRNDFTIVHDKKLYQILDKQAGKKVTVEERISGALHITYNARRLKYKQIALRPVKEKPEPKPRKITRPSLEHPWKKASYDRWLEKKAHSQTEKASKELVLSEV